MVLLTVWVGMSPVTSIPSTQATVSLRMSDAVAVPELVFTTIGSPSTPKMFTPLLMLPETMSVSRARTSASVAETLSSPS